MHRKITVTGANIVFLIVLMLFIAFSIVDAIVSGISGKELSNEYFGATIIITQYVLILIPVLVYAAANKLDFKEIFRFRKLDLLPALIIILIAFPAAYVANTLNYIVIYLLQFIGDIPPNPIPIPGNLLELGTGILIIAVSPAICEEMLHRGLLLSAYEKRGSIKAVVISSILFGIFHFDVTNLLGPIFLGLLIGYYVIGTNSIFAGMLAHFTNNAMVEIFSYQSRNEVQPDKITISLQDLGYQIILGCGSLVIVMLLIKLFNLATRGKAVLNLPISNVKEDIETIASHWPLIIIAVMYILFSGFYILSIVLFRVGQINP